MESSTKPTPPPLPQIKSRWNLFLVELPSARQIDRRTNALKMEGTLHQELHETAAITLCVDLESVLLPDALSPHMFFQ